MKKIPQGLSHRIRDFFPNLAFKVPAQSQRGEKCTCPCGHYGGADFVFIRSVIPDFRVLLLTPNHFFLRK